MMDKYCKSYVGAGTEIARGEAGQARDALVDLWGEARTKIARYAAGYGELKEKLCVQSSRTGTAGGSPSGHSGKYHPQNH